MAKRPKEDKPESIRCGDCVFGKPHKGLAVWCEMYNAGRVANSLRRCEYFKRKKI